MCICRVCVYVDERIFSIIRRCADARCKWELIEYIVCAARQSGYGVWIGASYSMLVFALIYFLCVWAIRQFRLKYLDLLRDWCAVSGIYNSNARVDGLDFFFVVFVFNVEFLEFRWEIPSMWMAKKYFKYYCRLSKMSVVGLDFKKCRLFYTNCLQICFW